MVLYTGGFMPGWPGSGPGISEKLYGTLRRRVAVIEKVDPRPPEACRRCGRLKG
jgi:hypothetical protein